MAPLKSRDHVPPPLINPHLVKALYYHTHCNIVSTDCLSSVVAKVFVRNVG